MAERTIKPAPEEARIEAALGPESGRRKDAEASRLAAELSTLADAAEPVPPPPRLKRRILASITEDGRFSGMNDRLVSLTGLGQSRVDELLRAARDPGGPGWTDGPGPGIRWYLFRAGPSRDEAPSALVYCDPGVTFPEHRHRGTEWALILDGRAHDSAGGEWNLGDVVEAAAGSSHSFTTGDLPLLAAVVAQDGVVLPGATR